MTKCMCRSFCCLVDFRIFVLLWILACVSYVSQHLMSYGSQLLLPGPILQAEAKALGSEAGRQATSDWIAAGRKVPDDQYHLMGEHRMNGLPLIGSAVHEHRQYLVRMLGRRFSDMQRLQAVKSMSASMSCHLRPQTLDLRDHASQISCILSLPCIAGFTLNLRYIIILYYYMMLLLY